MFDMAFANGIFKIQKLKSSLQACFSLTLLAPWGWGRGGGEYNVPQGYIFVKNPWTANDFKLKFCDF